MIIRLFLPSAHEGVKGSKSALRLSCLYEADLGAETCKTVFLE